MNVVSRMLWTVATLVLMTCVLMTCAAPRAIAAGPPADLCSLLPTAVVTQMLGSTYTGPTKTVAPRPFPGTNEGVDCLYKSRRNLVFRIYVDPSADAATQLFAKLKMYFGSGSTAVGNLGDEAYIDANHALHVRKGKVRFYLDGGGTTDQKREGLAAGIAGQL